MRTALVVLAFVVGLALIAQQSIAVAVGTLLIAVSVVLKDQNETQPANIVFRPGWGTVECSNSVVVNGEAVDGSYRTSILGHRITIYRGADIEKIFLHEYLHSIGLQHNTKQEKAEFAKKMREFGFDYPQARCA